MGGSRIRRLRIAVDLNLTASFLSALTKVFAGPSVRWVDCQPDTCQRVYFANHTSHVDPMVIWSSLPPDVRKVTRPTAAKDYWSRGWFRRHLARSLNALLIDRDKIKVHQSPIDLMIREIGDQYSLIVFPEGGRTHSDSGEIREFKSGIYYLNKKRPDLEMVPVYMDNMNRILPRGEFLPVPLLSRVVFGPPIWLEQGESKNDFLARARQSVLRLRDV